MAKTRMVTTSFWSDPFVQDQDVDTKLIFLYLLTNPHTDICGIYEITIKTICFETSLPENRVLKSIDRLSKANKISFQEGWVFIKNFVKHQQSNPKVKQGIERSLKLVPQAIIDRLSIDYDTLSHLNLTKPNLTKPNLNSNPSGSGEPQEEKKHGDPKINQMLEFLKKAIGLQDFTQPAKEQRFAAHNLVKLMEKLTPDVFRARIESILADDFKRKNCNSLQYLHGQIKGFVDANKGYRKPRIAII